MTDGNVGAIFEKQKDSDAMRVALENLRPRIRKDTQAILHLSSPLNEQKTLSDALSYPGSSFLNKFLLYLLYRCGAISQKTGKLKSLIDEHNIDPSDVICRYGADTLEHISGLFSDASVVRSRIQEMKDKALQVPRPLWDPGCFWKGVRPT